MMYNYLTNKGICQEDNMIMVYFFGVLW